MNMPIEQANITVIRCNDLFFPQGNEHGDYWEPYYRAQVGSFYAYGPTPDIAVQRCYSTSQEGESE